MVTIPAEIQKRRTLNNQSKQKNCLKRKIIWKCINNINAYWTAYVLCSIAHYCYILSSYQSTIDSQKHRYSVLVCANTTM